jgi:hypothetical protein
MLAVVEGAALGGGLACYFIELLDVRGHAAARRCGKDRRLKYLGRAAVLCPDPNGEVGPHADSPEGNHGGASGYLIF